MRGQGSVSIVVRAAYDGVELCIMRVVHDVRRGRVVKDAVG